MENEYCFLNLRDFDKICRICAKFVDTDVISCLQIEKMLNLCTSVQVSMDDKLPQGICKNCFQNLESAYLLRQLSEKTYHALRRIIEEQSVANVKLEDNLSTNNDTNWCKELKKEDEISEHLEDNSFDYQDLSSEQKKVQEDNKLLEKIQLKKELFEDSKSLNDEDSDWFELQIKTKRKMSKSYRPKKKKKECLDTTHLVSEESDWSQEETKKETKISVKKKKKTNLIICHICGKIMTFKSIKSHMISHEPKTTVLCKLCNKTFSHEKYLKDHDRRTHERKNTCLCQLCGMSFVSTYNLNRHKLTHNNDRPLFICELCDKTSKTKYHLQQHIDRVHGDKRTETCSVCSLTFYDKRILNQHMRRHTGEKPYQCKECGRRFAASGGLWAHMKTHLKSVKKEK